MICLESRAKEIILSILSTGKMVPVQKVRRDVLSLHETEYYFRIALLELEDNISLIKKGFGEHKGFYYYLEHPKKNYAFIRTHPKIYQSMITSLMDRGYEEVLSIDDVVPNTFYQDDMNIYYLEENEEE